MYLFLLLGAVGQALHLIHMGSCALSLQTATVGVGAGGWDILVELRVLSPRKGASGDPGESQWKWEAREGCLVFVTEL